MFLSALHTVRIPMALPSPIVLVGGDSPVPQSPIVAQSEWDRVERWCEHRCCVCDDCGADD